MWLMRKDNEFYNANLHLRVKYGTSLYLTVHWVLGICHKINNSSHIATCYVNDSLCILKHLALE